MKKILSIKLGEGGVDCESKVGIAGHSETVGWRDLLLKTSKQMFSVGQQRDDYMIIMPASLEVETEGPVFQGQLYKAIKWAQSHPRLRKILFPKRHMKFILK